MVPNFLAVFVDEGIGAVDAVHLGGFHDDVGLDFQGPEGRRRVRG